MSSGGSVSVFSCVSHPLNSAGRGTSLAALVDAVVQLGGVHEALQSLRKHLASQVRPSVCLISPKTTQCYHELGYWLSLIEFVPK